MCTRSSASTSEQVLLGTNKFTRVFFVYRYVVWSTNTLLSTVAAAVGSEIVHMHSCVYIFTHPCVYIFSAATSELVVLDTDTIRVNIFRCVAWNPNTLLPIVAAALGSEIVLLDTSTGFSGEAGAAIQEFE